MRTVEAGAVGNAIMRTEACNALIEASGRESVRDEYQQKALQLADPDSGLSQVVLMKVYDLIIGDPTLSAMLR